MFRAKYLENLPISRIYDDSDDVALEVEQLQAVDPESRPALLQPGIQDAAGEPLVDLNENLLQGPNPPGLHGVARALLIALGDHRSRQHHRKHEAEQA
jgi:hypothetical protein